VDGKLRKRFGVTKSSANLSLNGNNKDSIAYKVVISPIS
jgi:hypothetical protein